MTVDRDSIRKILIIQLRAIGDVVLTTAVLPVLRKHFPQAKLHFLTASAVAPLLQGLPELDAVLAVEHPESFLTVPRLINRIRRTHYDLIIDYQGTPGTAYLTYFSGARYRLGWKMKRRQWAYNLISSANQLREYVPVQKCKALEVLEIREVNTTTRIHIEEKDVERVREYFRTAGIDEQGFLINMTPLGKRQARQWIPERFARLSDMLVEKYGATVFYNWAPGEEKSVREVAALSRHPVHVLPAWPLSVFAAYLSQVHLHFSYDNGPKHLAIAVGTPTLSLFATAPPEHWNPPNQPDHAVLVPDVPCLFCGLRRCDSMICMKAITPEMVLQAMERMPAFQSRIRRRA